VVGISETVDADGRPDALHSSNQQTCFKSRLSFLNIEIRQTTTSLDTLYFNSIQIYEEVKTPNNDKLKVLFFVKYGFLLADKCDRWQVVLRVRIYQ
jgi:hypothetical protein